jgi:hypothetical protein
VLLVAGRVALIHPIVMAARELAAVSTIKRTKSVMKIIVVEEEDEHKGMKSKWA